MVIIGASAGGISAISRVLSGLDKDFEAPVLGVLHLSSSSSADNIIKMLVKNTSINCSVAYDGVMMQKGNFYLAPADFHMMVNDGLISINSGPRENRFRPSIDVLFRSVAINYGSRTIGIILSGLLDDGTSGMNAVKSCGGICIVQDPEEAQYNQMPFSVLSRIEVDYRKPLNEIPGLLKEILKNPLPEQVPVPEELLIENEITLKMMSSISELPKIAEHSVFICPDCGGGLWEIKGDPTHRYRCHTGHVYSERLLNELQGINLEQSLWVSIRMFEERKKILESIARHNERFDDTLQSSSIREIENHIRSLKFILKKMLEKNDNAEGEIK